MSVIIRGAEMPESCDRCEFCKWSNLHQTGQCLKERKPCFEDFSVEYRSKRAEFCPLIELPPHGDLIDRDAFMKKDVPFNGHWDENDGRFHCYPPTYMQAVDDIKAAPTVISAE